MKVRRREALFIAIPLLLLQLYNVLVEKLSLNLGPVRLRAVKNVSVERQRILHLILLDVKAICFTFKHTSFQLRCQPLTIHAIN